MVSHARYARRTSTQDMDELEADVYDLLCGDSYTYVVPSVFDSPMRWIPCKKGWVKRQAHHTKKFYKKHKKAILITTVVVVAAVVVTCIVLAAPAAAPAALAGAAGAVDGPHEKKSPEEKNQQPPAETFTEVFASQVEVC